MLRVARLLSAVALLAAPAWSQSGPTPPASFLQNNPDGEASFQLVAAATQGSNGLPQLVMEGSPKVGDSFHLEVESARPLTHGCLLFSPTFQPMKMARFGGTLYPGPTRYTQVFRTDGKGHSPDLLRLKVVDVSFVGAALGAQAILLDSQAVGGVAFTDAAWVTFGTDSNSSGDDDDEDDEDEDEDD